MIPLFINDQNVLQSKTVQKKSKESLQNNRFLKTSENTKAIKINLTR